MYRIACVLTVVAVGVSSAQAFHGRLGLWQGAPRSASYSPAPTYWFCPPAPVVSAGPIVMPVPDVYPKYAVPTPAPPSTTEPPTGLGESKLPKIISRSMESALKLSGNRCQVGFWNLAGREIMVTVEGQTWSLPKNQVLTLEIDRSFRWNVAGKAARSEHVSEGQQTHEVIIRD